MLDRWNIPKIRPGKILPAKSINGLRDAAIAQSRSRPMAGLPGFDLNGSLLLRQPRPPEFKARVTGTGNPHSFTEVYGVNSAYLYETLPNGRIGENAYELNGRFVPSGSVVKLHPVGGGAWYWFQWASKPSSGSGGGSGGIGTVPFCFCTEVPTTLTMTSASESCNFGMFQSCTIQYGPVPSVYAPLGLGANAFISTESFPDVLQDGALFQYLLMCIYNQYSLTRIYPVSIYGSPWQDAILYTWFVGSYGNTCNPFELNNGAAYPGSDSSCFVTINS